jgi:hypothetical protein
MIERVKIFEVPKKSYQHFLSVARGERADESPKGWPRDVIFHATCAVNRDRNPSDIKHSIEAIDGGEVFFVTRWKLASDSDAF